MSLSWVRGKLLMANMGFDFLGEIGCRSLQIAADCCRSLRARARSRLERAQAGEEFLLLGFVLLFQAVTFAFDTGC